MDRGPVADIPTSEEAVTTDRVQLVGIVAIPPNPRGVVLFAHGSGSSRFSPRNQFVARQLQRSGFSTCLFDLLTQREQVVDEQTRALRFDLELLTRRLVGLVDWIAQDPRIGGLPLGLFGASTGAAGALGAAALRPELVKCVVSRGGRPDLAAIYLARVHAATLLLVGGLDGPVIEMNRTALAQLPGPKKELQIIPGATHLFEESGRLEMVTEAAATFFRNNLEAPGDEVRLAT
ncbi:putative dienelactone hydrolase [Paratrimastix pyriformis]|uniref:Dienelactone hydrolase n=1 Tax=Paratrimastix pyriformis TaxID=342808 RepID=A0ABQ8UNC8_9EUKA|nr:putative dienelactone hydrolase [Paratrimastix pyriformis]